MRIRDWSSDVCSSDLARIGTLVAARIVGIHRERREALTRCGKRRADHRGTEPARHAHADIVESAPAGGDARAEAFARRSYRPFRSKPALHADDATRTTESPPGPPVAADTGQTAWRQRTGRAPVREGAGREE